MSPGARKLHDAVCSLLATAREAGAQAKQEQVAQLLRLMVGEFHGPEREAVRAVQDAVRSLPDPEQTATQSGTPDENISLDWDPEYWPIITTKST